MDRIYVQTNDAERNAVVAFDRGEDGNLTSLGRFETGGSGSGTPHLASQSSLAISGDRLLVTNAGSSSGACPPAAPTRRALPSTASSSTS
jgi:hypothetical protein